jgi:poly-gamma-glutamate synthesis protein (capsule biosynthesis protein)
VQDAEFSYAKDSIPVPVFYSVGTFISNQRKPNTNGGIVACVEIGSTSKTILRTSYLPVYVYKGVLNDIYQYHLIPTTDFIGKPSKFPINRTDSIALTNFDKETRLKLRNIKLLHQSI